MRNIIIGLLLVLAGVAAGVVYANAITKQYLQGWVHQGDTYHYEYDRGVIKDIVIDECGAELYKKDLVDSHCPECKHKIGD